MYYRTVTNQTHTPTGKVTTRTDYFDTVEDARTHIARKVDAAADPLIADIMEDFEFDFTVWEHADDADGRTVVYANLSPGDSVYRFGKTTGKVQTDTGEITFDFRYAVAATILSIDPDYDNGIVHYRTHLDGADFAAQFDTVSEDMIVRADA